VKAEIEVIGKNAYMIVISNSCGEVLERCFVEELHMEEDILATLDTIRAVKKEESVERVAGSTPVTNNQ